MRPWGLSALEMAPDLTVCRALGQAMEAAPTLASGDSVRKPGSLGGLFGSVCGCASLWGASEHTTRSHTLLGAWWWNLQASDAGDLLRSLSG